MFIVASGRERSAARTNTSCTASRLLVVAEREVSRRVRAGGGRAGVRIGGERALVENCAKEREQTDILMVDQWMNKE